MLNKSFKKNLNPGLISDSNVKMFYGCSAPRVLTPFRGGGIAYLNDPESYAGWSFHTPVRATQVRQVEG